MRHKIALLRKAVVRASVRSRLVLLGAAVLVPVCSALALTIFLAFRESEADARRETVTLAETTARSLDQLVIDARHIMAALAGRPLVQAVDKKRCDPILADLLNGLPRFANTAVVDTRGNVVCSAVPQPGGVPASVARSEWFREVRRTNVFAVGAPIVGPITGRWVSVLARPVRADGEVRGYVALPLDLVSLPGLLRPATLPEGSTITVLSPSGVIVTRVPESARWIGHDARSSEVGGIALGVRRGGTTAIARDVDGVERVYAITRVPASGWLVYVGVPTSSAFASARRSVVVASVAAVLSLLIALTLGGLVARSIRRPVRSLSRAADARIEGGVEVRVAEQGPAEVAALARSFNAMMDAEQRAARALADTEEHYRNVFEQLGDPVIVVDVEDLVIVNCSPAVTDVLGYDPAELVGSTTRRLFVDDAEYERFGAVAREPPGDGVTRALVTLRRKDGVAVMAETSARTRTDPATGRRRYIGIIRDVTERIRAQVEIERLLEAERAARAEAEAARVHATHILEGIVDGFVAFDRELRYSYVNATAGELFGRDPRSLIGKGYLEEYPEATGSASHQAYERALAEGEPFEFEEYYEPWDRWFENRVYPTDYGVSVFFHEVTDRKHAELETARSLAAEREARAALDAFIAAAPLAIGFLDADLRHVLANDRLMDVTGLSPADLIGRRVADVLPGMPSLEPVLRRVLETGEPVLGQEYGGFTTALHPEGDAIFSATYFQVRDDAGDAAGVGAFIEDVTDARKASDTLAVYARRLENLRRIDADILRAESREETSAAALARIRDLIPCVRASIVDLDVDGDTGRLVAAVSPGGPYLPTGPYHVSEFGLDLEALRDGRTLTFDDLQVEAPAGRPFAGAREMGVRAMLIVPLLVEGELVGALGISGDTPGQYGADDVEIAQEVANQLAVALRHARLREEAERHSSELEARVEERTAELAERNNELDAFSYTISHDLRAPLRAMKGFSQALVEDYGDALDSEARDLMGRIVGAAQRMDELIADVLAYSRLTRTEIRSDLIDADIVVDDVLRTLEPRITEAGADVHVERPLGRVLAHGPTLSMGISNLVDNALRYREPGAAPHIEIRSECRDGFVRLWVEDAGIGIPPEHHERIFGVFERLHGQEAYSGTGIGLASVRKGLERMGGRVGVESEPGRGSRFWVELRAEEGAG